MASSDKGSSLKRFLFGSISRKLVLFFMLAAVLMTSIGTYAFYRFSDAALTEEVDAHFTAAAASRAHHVESFIDALKGRMTDFASDGKIKDCLYDVNNDIVGGCTSGELSAHLVQNKLPAVEGLYEVFALDQEGKVAGATGRGGDIGRDFSTDALFIEGRQRAFVKDIQSDPASGRIGMAVSAPVMRNGEFVGVVAGRIDADGLYGILQDRAGLGETGEIYLVNQEGYMASPSRFIEGAVLRQKVDTENARNCRERDVPGLEYAWHQSVHIFPDYRGIAVIGTYAYLPEMGWCLLAEIDEAETLGAQRSRLLAFAVVLSFVLLCGFAGLVMAISRKISKPIRQLHHATEDVERGNFKTRVDIRTGDELEQLGKAFNKTAAALALMDEEHSELEKAKTEFLSITSHELRSPMTPMKAQLQMLLKGYFGKLNKRQRRAADIVLKNATRLDQILQDFLEISRIEAARLKFNFVRTSLEPHIRGLVQAMGGFMPEKRIKLRIRTARLPVIEVDPDRTMQVLRNLINNAIKFSPPKSEVVVGASLRDKEILISVKDQGIGISPEDQRRLFEPFFQAEHTMYRKYGGTGLGLAICKGIVESQEGKIWVESEAGKGSIFYFTVPLEPVRRMKPIRLLFSSTQRIEQKVRGVLVSCLGPLGQAEFDVLKEKGSLEYGPLKEYIRLLRRSGVIDDDAAERMADEMASAFGIVKQKKRKNH